MDALAEFTAMSPPRASASVDSEDPDDGRSGRRASQSFASQGFASQSSADPRAFDGLPGAPRPAGSVGGLVGLRGRGREAAEAAGHFSELFSADTQDEEALAAVDATPRPAPAGGQSVRRATPPPSLLASVDRARALRKSRSTTLKSPVRRESSERRASGAGSSELSEDLAQFGRNAVEAVTNKPLLSPRQAPRPLPAAEGETKDEEQRIQDEESDDGSDTEMENDTRIQPSSAKRDANTVRDDSDETAVSDTGTEPYVASDDDDMEEETELFSELGPAKPADVTDSDSGKDSVEPRTLAEYETEEPEARGFSEPGEDDDEYPPTQPSKAFISSSSLPDTVDEVHTAVPKMLTPLENEPERVSPPKVALKKRDKSAPTSQVVLSESQERSYDFVASQCNCGKARCECQARAEVEPVDATNKSSTTIRSLEFSFAMPESQDTDMSEKMESTPDIGVAAAKALQAFDLEDSESIANTNAKKPRAKKSDGRVSRNQTPKKPKKTKSTSGSKDPLTQGSRSSSVESTPVLKRKRKRAFSPSSASRDSDESSSEAQSSVIEGTPQRTSRRTGRVPTSQSTPSSSQKARTRAKLLSPLPSNRSYVSRSRTIFKFKFEFVLTGFVKDGETSLTELIQEHGGKVVGREHEVLYPGNSKAVVIATPVSWRKLKFMHAVACGIPVVHPDWIQQCIKAASILPFDGFTVPSGYSLTTRKFECFPVRKVR